MRNEILWAENPVKKVANVPFKKNKNSEASNVNPVVKFFLLLSVHT